MGISILKKSLKKEVLKKCRKKATVNLNADELMTLKTIPVFYGNGIRANKKVIEINHLLLYGVKKIEVVSNSIFPIICNVLNKKNKKVGMFFIYKNDKLHIDKNMGTYVID